MTLKRRIVSRDRSLSLTLKTLWGDEGTARTPYLTRISLGRASLHIFWRGDADLECHDHPWDFWTFPVWPLRGYNEIWRHDHSGNYYARTVGGWRLHYRPAEYAHRVLTDWQGRPIVTLIWKSSKRREWGFFCPRGWTPWQQFIERNGCGEGRE